MNNSNPKVDMFLHGVWRKVRRPFRYPKCCSKCVWEIYDVNQAGCLKCGAHHMCLSNSVDNKCPLFLCDNLSRVCTITGFVLPEVRHSRDEFMDNIIFSEKYIVQMDIDAEVVSVVGNLLMSDKARECRIQENKKQYQKMSHHMYKQMKIFKMYNPGKYPNICQIIASCMAQEKYWRFIKEASEDLSLQCAHNITICLLELRNKGAKITSGTRLQELVCGLLYMIKNGLTFNNRILLKAIPEIDSCLPHENKIELYFGISSKVICMTENEVKLIFRECYQV